MIETAHSWFLYIWLPVIYVRHCKHDNPPTLILMLFHAYAVWMNSLEDEVPKSCAKQTHNHTGDLTGDISCYSEAGRQWQGYGNRTIAGMSRTDANLTNLRTGIDQKRYGDVNTLDWEIAPFLTRARLPRSYTCTGDISISVYILADTGVCW